MSGCHSAPFTGSGYGADGPLVPGPEARLTYDSGPAGKPSWAATGEGILYAFSPRPYQRGDSMYTMCGGAFGCVRVPTQEFDGCIALLPSGGGSARWQLCETAKAHTDSVDILGAAALDSDGTVLYQEFSGTIGLITPLGGHADLWIGDPLRPLVRRKLMSLYRDVLGVDPLPDDQINWLLETNWAGRDTFYVIGEHLRPDATDTTIGIARGVISSTGASLWVIPATDKVIHYGIAAGEGELVWLDSLSVLHGIALRDWSTRPVPQPPLTPAGKLLDIGCEPRACVVLAHDVTGGKAAWSLWSVDLDSGSWTRVESYDHSITSAKVSPDGKSAVAVEGENLYLLDLTQ